MPITKVSHYPGGTVLLQYIASAANYLKLEVMCVWIRDPAQTEEVEVKSKWNPGRPPPHPLILGASSPGSIDYCKGACTYDVCRGRGSPKADDSTDKLRGCDSDKGGGGKKTKIVQTSYVHAS